MFHLLAVVTGTPPDSTLGTIEAWAVISVPVFAIIGVLWAILKRELRRIVKEPNGGLSVVDQFATHKAEVEAGFAELRAGQDDLRKEVGKIKHATSRREQRDFNRLVEAVREVFREDKPS